MNLRSETAHVPRIFVEEESLMTNDVVVPKKFLSRWLIHLLFSVGSIFVPVGVALLAIELRIRWYVYNMGINRSQLSESYGLGFEFLAMIFMSFVVILPIMIFLWWLAIRYSKRS